MPLLRTKEIRDMSSEERLKKIGDFRTELVRLQTMIRAGGTVENPARIKQLRKTIPRILTIENEEKLKPNKTKKEEKPEKAKQKRSKKEKKNK
ncbi:MAG: 50S ribosomal protein L29 [Candidatus Bathyarchaeia archaeon]